MSENKLDKSILEEQALLLANWNKENIQKEPEQVRKNIETLSILANLILSRPGMR